MRKVNCLVAGLLLLVAGVIGASGCASPKPSAGPTTSGQPLGPPPFPLPDLESALATGEVCGQRVGAPLTITDEMGQQAEDGNHIGSSTHSPGSTILYTHYKSANKDIAIVDFDTDDTTGVIQSIELSLAGHMQSALLMRVSGLRFAGIRYADYPNIAAYVFTTDRPAVQLMHRLQSDDGTKPGNWSVVLGPPEAVSLGLQSAAGIAAILKETDPTKRAAVTAMLARMSGLYDAWLDEDLLAARNAAVAVLDAEVIATAEAAYAQFRTRWENGTFDQRVGMLAEVAALKDRFKSATGGPLALTATWGDAEAADLRAELQQQHDKLAETKVVERQMLQLAIAGNLAALAFRDAARGCDLYGVKDGTAVTALKRRMDQAEELVKATPALSSGWNGALREIVVDRIRAIAKEQAAALPGDSVRRLLLEVMLNDGQLGAIGLFDFAFRFDSVTDIVEAREILVQMYKVTEKGDAAMQQLWRKLASPAYNALYVKARLAADKLADHPAEHAVMLACSKGDTDALGWAPCARVVDAGTEPYEKQIGALADGVGLAKYRDEKERGKTACWPAVRAAMVKLLIQRTDQLATAATGAATRAVYEVLAATLRRAPEEVSEQRWSISGLEICAAKSDAAPDAAGRLTALMPLYAENVLARQLGRQIVAKVLPALRPEVEAAADAMMEKDPQRCATCAALWLMLHVVTQDANTCSWPQPVAVADWYDAGREDTYAYKARSALLLPMLAILPAVQGSTSFSKDLTTIMKEGPFPEWPLRWCAGLLPGDLDDFRDVVGEELGTPARMILVEVPGEANAFSWAQAGSGAKAASYMDQIQTEFMTPEMKQEREWLLQEKTWIDSEATWTKAEQAELEKLEGLRTDQRAQIEALRTKVREGRISVDEANRQVDAFNAGGPAIRGRVDSYNRRVVEYESRRKAFNDRVGPYNRKVYEQRASYAEKVDKVFRGSVQRFIRDQVDAWEKQYRADAGASPATDTEVMWMRWFFGVGEVPGDWMYNLAKPAPGNLRIRTDLAYARIWDTGGKKGVGTGFCRWWNAVAEDPTVSASERAEKRKWFIDTWLTRFTGMDFFHNVLMNSAMNDGLVTELRDALPQKERDEITAAARQMIGGR